MLNAEEARARLRAIEDTDWEAGAARRIRRLKRQLRPTAGAIIEPDPRLGGGQARRDHRRRLERAAGALDELDAAARTDVMAAIHPQMGATFSRWWVDAQRQPYTVDYTRRAFRAPRNPALTRDHRMMALRHHVAELGPYDRDPVWLAAWAPFVGRVNAGELLAAAIDAGGPHGDDVFRTLLDVGNGEHAIGVMDRHVIVGLLRAGRSDGWEFVERLLLAAQRQEGLRQSILEAVDEAHPGAFDRVLATIVDHDLLRFAATVRAVGTWVGLAADAEQIPLVRQRVEALLRFRSDTGARDAAIGRDPWDTYMALCATAMTDVEAALAIAVRAAASDDRDVRAATVRFLAATNLDEARQRLQSMFDDPDIAVAALAHRITWIRSLPSSEDLFGRLEGLARRLPDKERTVEAVGVEVSGVVLSRPSVVQSIVTVLGDRPLSRLMPWFNDMNPTTRQWVARLCGDRPRLTADVRHALVAMVGDRSPLVRQQAAAAMAKIGLVDGEAPALEALLSRRAGDLRRGVIAVLAHQSAPDSVASAGRLWASGDEAKCDAACELLTAVTPRTDAVIAAARAFADGGLTTQQQKLLDGILGASAIEGADDPGLGLYDPRRRASVPHPVARRRPVGSGLARRLLSDLDDLAESLRDTTLTITSWQGTREVLLADATFLPSPFHRRPAQGSDEDQGLILPEVFHGWWSDRAADLREDDGLDALRALTALTGRRIIELGARDEQQRWWISAVRQVVGEHPGELRHGPILHHVLSWMLVEHASVVVVDECLDAVETLLAAVPRSVLDQMPTVDQQRWERASEWRHVVQRWPGTHFLDALFAVRPELFDAPRIGRLFLLRRWVDEPRPNVGRHPVEAHIRLAAHRHGVATDDDILDAFLLAPSRLLTDFTRRRRSPLEAQHPAVVALADRVRRRAIEIERRRGELPTAASQTAIALGSISGAALTMELLARLGRGTLVRGHAYGNLGREAVYSRLLQVSHPDPADDADSVRAAAKAAGVTDKRLVDLAMYAPQWARLVEGALGWEGFDDAVWWFHAHTKDDRWAVDVEVRETWAALSAERTPLASEDLVEGAVDVDWFARCRATLGQDRWKTVHAAAKLASGGNGHRRAQLFAEAMVGDATEDAIVARIRDKRHQDSIRALGLLPLSEDATERRGAMLRRYQLLREFERGSSKFGSQRQASERTAVRIGVENLARTAGAADPQRFVWAMEAAESADLADGPVTVADDGIEVSLSVSAEGVPELVVRRGDKVLRSVPASLRKRPEVAALRDRNTGLARQVSRVRASLETAMVRQDAFVDADFEALERHPIVAPMLRLVVFVDEAGRTLRRGERCRFVDAGGAAVEPCGVLRLAHPVDLVGSGCWLDWQAHLFDDAHRQPFKQVFRELYVLTDAERATSPMTCRYEGHQVQPRQALALLGSRGWLGDRDSGDVARVFHRHDLVARLTFLDGFLTPAEVELPTLRSVIFTRRGSYVAEPIDSVAPIVFSEAMRDLDLVVSVAHAGGVDPEATASTVEMRAALVRETARLLELDNVRPVDSHVVIEGILGEYSVHLGSGVVHRRPGGAVCIIPVDSQRRGRLFLPFADDDPKTAEVVSKVLLLARDTEIKDPTILQQLRS